MTRGEEVHLAFELSEDALFHIFRRQRGGGNIRQPSTELAHFDEAQERRSIWWRGRKLILREFEQFPKGREKGRQPALVPGCTQARRTIQ